MTDRKITDRPMSAEDVAYWLERAGITLQCLPDRSPRLGMRLMSVEMRMAAQLVPRETGRLRPSLAPGDIGAMDEAFRWLGLIANPVRRRIVAARLLVNPTTGRHRFSIRAIARLIGADHHAVGSWWEQGIAEIVDALGR